MTDKEILEYIKKNLIDTNLCFGTGKTILDISVPYDKEVEAWAKKAKAERKAREVK